MILNSQPAYKCAVFAVTHRGHLQCLGSLIKRLFLSRKGEDDVSTLWELNLTAGLRVLFLLLQIPKPGNITDDAANIPRAQRREGAAAAGLGAATWAVSCRGRYLSHRDFAAEEPVFLHQASRFN